MNNDNNIIDLTNETNENDLVIVNLELSTSSSSSNSLINKEFNNENNNNAYWNEQNQNEDTSFLNLFANTLLNDDLGKEVDLLGLDNLQLNLVNPTVSDENTINNYDNNQTLLHQQLTNDNDDLVNNSNKIRNSKIILELDKSKILMNDTNATSTTSITSESSAEAYSNNNANLQITTIEFQQNSSSFFNENDDDKVFKKPSNDHLLNGTISNCSTSTNNNRRESSTEQKQIINLFESIDLMSEIKSNKTIPENNNAFINSKKDNINKPTTLAAINLSEFKNHFKSLNNSKKQTDTKIKSTAIDSFNNSCNSSSSNNCSSTLNKILSLKRSRNKQRSKLSANNNCNNLNNKKEGDSSCSNSKSTPTKFFSIKQTKLLSSASSLMMTKSSSNSKKLSDSSKFNKEKLKQIKKKMEDNVNSKAEILLPNVTSTMNTLPQATSSTINFEPLSKKFAVDIELSNNNTIGLSHSNNSVNNLANEHNDENKILLDINNSKQSPTNLGLVKNSSFIIKKKDEVDLDIKDLSLLDLHSSEDDSSSIDFFVNDGDNSESKLRKNTRSSSNDHFTSTSMNPSSLCTIPVTKISSSTLNSPINTCKKINEIITKRIKYTPVSTLLVDNNSTQCVNTNLSSSAIQISSPVYKNPQNSSNTKIDRTNQSMAKSFDSTSNDQMNKTTCIFSSSAESFQFQPSNLIIFDQNQTNSNLAKNQISISNIFNHNNSNVNNANSISLSSINITSPSTIETTKNESLNCSSVKFKNKRKKKDNIINLTNLDDENAIQLISSNSSTTSNNNSKVQKPNIEFSNSQVILITSTESDSPPILLNKNKLNSFKTLCLENDTVQHMKNLDINNDLTNHSTLSTISSVAPSTSKDSNYEPQDGNNSSFCDLNFKLNLNDSNSRNYLWNLLKTHSTLDEIKSQFGSMLHDKITFWDLVELKLKFSQMNQLKTTYNIIDDYTMLYSNMSGLLERIVKDHSKTSSNSNLNKKNGGESSSRSRSSSRNCRKQSTTSINKI